ncbi:DUF92 domain-containing protein [Bacillus sp. V3-13]|uniref:DUF92 domain-containing protein n=1 Tax=Bacillus sp. V3-13 TaxID=2053728 RepID=UPI000C75B059|nr:DUF92 domain-containing protein [Bacillus sp. V3-13]PLR76954.1 DUF92 domain-containing protein [Bacillus sp. V3-13]
MSSTLILGLFVVAAAVLAYLSRSLSKSGALASVLIGFAIGAGTGLQGLILLGAFFISSSLWSKYRAGEKAFADKHEKGSRRDWKQVLANGAIPAGFALLHDYTHDPVWVIGFSIALAAANADTWASEVGSLSKTDPILIRNFQRVEKGTSGAVTVTGTAAALCGSLLIAILATGLFRFEFIIALLIFLLGFIGNLFDTFLGAYLQAAYQCNQCRSVIEKSSHCGKQAQLIKGFRLFDNDAVNFLSCLIAAAAGMLVYIMVP